MSTFLGTSFLIPGIISLFAFGAWVWVCRRMLNLKFPRWQVIAVFIWSVSVLSQATRDFVGTHYYENEVDAVMAVLNKIIIRTGYLVLGVIYFQLIGRLHPHRLAVCSTESGCHRARPKRMDAVLAR